MKLLIPMGACACCRGPRQGVTFAYQACKLEIAQVLCMCRLWDFGPWIPTDTARRGGVIGICDICHLALPSASSYRVATIALLVV
jgi:hypothetical protein